MHDGMRRLTLAAVVNVIQADRGTLPTRAE
jgi:hypothetical protein